MCALVTGVQTCALPILRLPAPTVLEAFQQFPAALLRLTRLIARRLRQNAALKPHVAVHRRNSLAVVAATPSAPARLVAERLHSCLSTLGQTQLVDMNVVKQAFDADDRKAMRTDAVAERRLIEYLNALQAHDVQIGKAACRERGCQSGKISG